MKIFDSSSKLAVMLSIRPQWCELIASGKKTVEIRKTKPKLKPPFKVYVYCTKPRRFFAISKGLYVSDENLFLVNNKVKMCDGFGVEYEDSEYKLLNCKVIGEFTCDEIFPIRVFENGNIQDYNRYNMEHSCVLYDDIANYIGYDKIGYGWHISDLVLYDKPKFIFNYLKPCVDKYGYCQGCKHGLITYPSSVEIREDLDWFGFDEECTNYLKKAPQSWCYVQEV